MIIYHLMSIELPRLLFLAVVDMNLGATLSVQEEVGVVLTLGPVGDSSGRRRPNKHLVTVENILRVNTENVLDRNKHLVTVENILSVDSVAIILLLANEIVGTPIDQIALSIVIVVVLSVYRMSSRQAREAIQLEVGMVLARRIDSDDEVFG